MIRAQRSGWRSALARWYVRAKVRGFFRGVWARGPAPAADISLLAYANHPGFWDGFILQALAERWGLEPYCMVEEQNLLRFPFLARLGAFSIRPGDAGSSRESFRYACQLLERPGRVLFVFPEGRLAPWAGGPLELRRGFEVLARRSGVPCVPVALRYAFFESERPDALVSVGPQHAATETRALAGRLEGLLSGLHQAVSTEGFELVVRGSAGVAARWERLKRTRLRRPIEC